MASYIDLLVRAQAQANAANVRREKEIRSIYDTIINRQTKESAFYKGSMADIEREKRKGIGQTYQQLISSGLYGTTTAANVPRTWETGYAAPQRLKLEDIMEQRRTSAQQAKAGFLERIEDVGPGYSAIANLAQSAGAVQTPITPIAPIVYGASSYKTSGLLYPKAGAAGRLGA